MNENAGSGRGVSGNGVRSGARRHRGTRTGGPAARALAGAVLFGTAALVLVLATTLRKDEQSPTTRPRSRSVTAAADARGARPLTLRSARASCYGCAPANTDLRFDFDESVEAEAVARAVKVVPAVRLVPDRDGASQHVVLRGDFAPEAEYTVEVAAGLTATSGARLPSPVKFTFRTGPHDPIVRMPHGHAVLPPGRGLPVQLRHVGGARLRLYRIEPDELDEAARFVGLHEAHYDPVADLSAPIRRREVTRTLSAAAGDAEGIQEVDVFAAAGGPLVLAVLEGGGLEPRVTMVQRGDLATVFKVGETSSLVWVADSATGTPIADASVEVYDGPDLRARVRTNASGIAHLPGRSRLEVPAAELERRARAERRRRARAATDRGGAGAEGAGNDHGEADVGDEIWGEDDWGTGDAYAQRPLRAVVRHAKGIGYSSTLFSEGLEPWRFDLASSWTRGPTALRGMVTAERGIYRPGESVHLLAMLRRREASGRLVPPRGPVRFTVTDPDGSTVVDERVRPTAFGTATVEPRLPSSARLGRYTVRVQSGDQALTSTFEVAAYRTPTFEVRLPPVGPAERDGDAVVVPVRAAYHYGAPVRGGRVQWTASWRPHVPNPRGFEGFAFGDPERAPLRFLTSGETTLGDDGAALVRIERAALPAPEDPAVSGASAYDLVVEASVRDAADDTVSASTVRTVTRAPVVVGVRNDHWVVDAARGWDVRVVVLDAADADLPDAAVRAVRPGRRLLADLVRWVWVAAAEESRDGFAYDGGRYEERVVATRELVSGNAPVALHLDLPGAGNYALRVRDAQTGVAAHANVWAWGAGHSSVGPARGDVRVAVQPERDGYAPGEVARMVVASPFTRSTALVTVEREGVLDARVVALEGAATPIEVEVEERHLPNVFVGVTLLSRLGAPLAGPPLRIGYAALDVRPESRRLSVKVEPVQTTMRPGERAEVDVTVTDAAGRPARAEVTLWAADEGVLALTGYATPDPFATAYTPFGLQTFTSSSLVRWTAWLPDTWDDPGVGDGGPAADTMEAMRSRFLSTAFFSRPVVTDEHGRAHVRFDLPDNLTRWRVMAAVCDAGDRFGKGEAAIVTRKPLQVVPSLPRFLVEGDVVEAGVVVHDDTGRDGDVEVRVEVDGAAELVGGGAQRLPTRSGGQVSTHVRVRATGPGEARIRAFAAKGGERDAFEVRLPVHAPTHWQSWQVADGVVDGRAEATVTLPAGVAPGHAELLVTVSPTPLAALERGLESLVEYPNGCVEQTTSRLIPMVLLEDLLRDLGSERFASHAHRQRMAQAIDHVLEHQNDDGGFGLWPPSPSEGFLTAYALWGLLTARDHGYDVPQACIERGLAYLAAHATDGDDIHGQFSPKETAPFSAYVLALARRDDQGLGAELMGRREALTRFGVGLLATALERRDADATALLGELLGARRSLERGGSLVADPERAESESFLRFGRDLRATASTVQALVAAGRFAEAEDLVAGILAERAPDGSWGSTYNNLWALYAVSAYARAMPKARQHATVVVKLGGREVARWPMGPHGTARRLAIPHEALVQAQVPRDGASSANAASSGAVLELVAPAAARLRFSARLRYAMDLAHHRPSAQGMRVTRELRDAETGTPVSTPRVGQLLRVRLTLDVDAPQRQVALTDRLPAGLEPVDTALRTAAQRAAALGGDGRWVWREMHDERVAFFANFLDAGTHHAEYLARATRAGEFVRPPVAAEAMYDPVVHAIGPIERLAVERSTR